MLAIYKVKYVAIEKSKYNNNGNNNNKQQATVNATLETCYVSESNSSNDNNKCLLYGLANQTLANRTNQSTGQATTNVAQF